MTNDHTLPGVARTLLDAAHRAICAAPNPIGSAIVDEVVRQLDLVGALRALEEAVGSRDVAFRAAISVPPDSLGMATFAYAGRPTVGAGLESLSRYLRLIHPELAISISSDTGWSQVALSVPPNAPNDEVTRVAAEFLFAHLVHRIRASSALTIQKVTFRHAPVPYRSSYDGLFVAPVEFARDVDSITIPTSILEAKQPPHDSATGVRVRRGAMAALRSLPKVGNTSYQVREVILDDLIGGIPHMTRVASRLGMTVPVLARVLKEENATFAGLREALLHRLACEYLNDAALSQTDVAFAVGFVDFNVFVATFTRWTGKSPIEYRGAS